MYRKQLFRISIGNYTLTLKGPVPQSEKERRKAVSEYNKYRYQNNINGTRDKALARARRNKRG